MDWFSEILKNWKLYYYTEPFEIICIIIALTAGLLFAKKDPVTTIFLIYTFSGLASVLYIIYITQAFGFESARRSINISMMNLIISYIELFAFMFFFYNTIYIKTVKIFIKLSLLTFTLINLGILFKVLFFELSLDHLRKSSNATITLQLFPLLFLCFFYYNQILNFKRKKTYLNAHLFGLQLHYFFISYY